MSKSGAAVPSTEPGAERTLLQLAALLVRNFRVLIGLPILSAAAAVVFALMLGESYTVESRFMPESGQTRSASLSGLAAQFGLELGSAEAGESVDFYAELLESHDLLRSAVLTEYRVAAGGDTVVANLVELLEVKGPTPAHQVRNAVAKVSDLVDVRPDPSARIVTVRTSAPWPDLAVQLNQRVLGLVSEFNLGRRQSRAGGERRFLESRVQEAERELREAEADLARFLTENRRYDESPQLAFEHGRLQRRLELVQQVYMTLAQGHEQARLDEVRNTPVITILDHPRPPALQTAPRLPVSAILGLLFGFFLAVTLVALRETVAGVRRRAPERYEELRSAIAIRPRASKISL